MPHLFALVLLSITITAALSAADNPKLGGAVEATTLEDLKRKSAELGRPGAILYLDTASTCPLHNGQCTRWLDNSMLANYVVLKVDWKSKSPEFSAVARLRRESKDKAGNMIPMLFLVDQEIIYRDVLPYNLADNLATKALQREVSDFGVVLPVAEAEMISKELEKVTPLLTEGKIDNARAILKKVKPVAAQAPRAGFAKTYTEAVAAFNQSIVKECEDLLKALPGKSPEERLKKVTPALRKHRELLSDETMQKINSLANSSL